MRTLLKVKVHGGAYAHAPSLMIADHVIKRHGDRSISSLSVKVNLVDGEATYS